MRIHITREDFYIFPVGSRNILGGITMNLQNLIDRLNELKNECELDASQVDVRIKLADYAIDSLADEDLKDHLRYENFWVWKKEFADIDSYEGFSDTGETKIFESVVIQGGG